MNFMHVAIMVTILLVAMISSMVYYGSRGKKKMGELFTLVADGIGGTVVQKNRMHYPHLTARVKGRPVQMFVHLSEGHRKTSDIMYLVLSTPLTLPSTTLVVTEGFFEVAEGKGPFNEVAGDYLKEIMPGHYVYAEDEDQTIPLFEDGSLARALTPLSRFPNIVLGPDAITAGKPYGGAGDLSPDRVIGEMEKLVDMADLLDQPQKNKKGKKAKKAAASL